MVYGVEPDLTREGGSIPVTLTLQEATGKNGNISALFFICIPRILQ